MDYKIPERVQISNKATFGRVINIAGSDYMPGAAYLSSISSLKIGCGYCFLISSEKVISIVASKTSNVVFVPFEKLEQNLEVADVVEIGCGLSTSDAAKNIFLKTIDKINKECPLIIDADGINILSKNREVFLSKGIKNVVLTPHPKEAARLLDCSTDEILKSPKFCAKEISKEYNCITVLKTHQTYVYSSDGRDYMNNSGNSALAKAGSGDVLSGIISGLIAQGGDIFEMCALGVYLHGVCAELASKQLTQYCVMADDLINFIPQALNFVSKFN